MANSVKEQAYFDLMRQSQYNAANRKNSFKKSFDESYQV